MTDVLTGTFGLKRVAPRDGKPYYKPDGGRERAALAAAYADIKAAYGLRQASRNRVLADVKQQMDAPGDSIVLRLDVTSCFENIDYDVLRRRLVADHRLKAGTMATVDAAVDAYRRMGAQRGLPRGLNTTGALAEIYMWQIDRSILSMPGVQMYRRYVDDSIIFFDPAVAGADAHTLFAEVDGIYRRAGMQLHNPDVFPYKGDIIDSKLNCDFPFLGYDISRTPDAARSVWRMPDNTCMGGMYVMRNAFDRFFARIGGDTAACADDRHAHAHLSPLAELLAELRLATSNRVSVDNGRRVRRGLSFNFGLLTTTEQFDTMDAYLLKQINRVTPDRMPDGFMATGTHHTPEETAAYIRRRCMKFGFARGYAQYKFSDSRRIISPDKTDSDNKDKNKRYSD